MSLLGDRLAAASDNFGKILDLNNRWGSRNLSPLAAKGVERIARKAWGKVFAGLIDAPTPATLVPDGPLDTVIAGLDRIAPTLDRFVIKPALSKNSWGVFAFRRAPDGGFRQLRSGDTLDSAAIAAMCRAERQQRVFADRWFVEDLVEPAGDPHGPLIDDYKFYMFYGRIGCILHKHAAPGRRARFAWYDAGWSRIETGKHVDRADRRLAPPRSADALTALATTVSANILRPFARVDLYDAAGGPQMGEITLKPGRGDLFSPDFARILAAAWENAHHRLRGDLRKRRLDPQVALFKEIGAMAGPTDS